MMKKILFILSGIILCVNILSAQELERSVQENITCEGKDGSTDFDIMKIQSKNRTDRGWQIIEDQDFESTFPSGDWSRGHNSGYVDAEWDDWYCWYNSSDESAGCADVGGDGIGCGDNYPNNMHSWMKYGPFDLSSSAITDADFNFVFSLECENNTNYDYFFVGSSTNGTNFSGDYYAGSHTDAYVDFDLSSRIGESEVWIVFIFHSDASISMPNGAQVDDVVIWKNETAGNSDDFFVQVEAVSNSTLEPGESFTASCEQHYSGNSTSTLYPKLGYYLSTNSTYGSSDILLGDDESSLSASDTYDPESESLTIPSGTTPGSYYILYFADYDNAFPNETNENNNVSSVSIQVISPSTITMTAPSSNVSVTQGQSVLLEWTGSGPTGSVVSLRRDLDNTWENGNETWIVLSQPTSGSYSWNTSSVPEGTYYVAAMISEGSNYSYDYAVGTVTISENNSDDFFVQAEAVSNSTLEPGESFTASCEQHYSGNSTSTLYPKLGYYLSTNSTYGSSDIPLGDDESSLSASDTYDPESESLTIPSGTTPGSYYILYFADYDNAFPNETNENNNVSSVPIQVSNQVYPDINVTPTSLTIQESGKSNANHKIITNYDKTFKPPLTEYVFDTIIDEDGNIIYGVIVPGIPPENHREPIASPSRSAIMLSNIPAFNWSFGCSATSAAMSAGYFDNNGYPDMYTGPTNGGVCPQNNSSWPDVTINGENRHQCPLSATNNGLDGRTTRGHVDDYWILYGNSDPDPWITNGWTEHTWGNCTADYMGTNQSTYESSDGSTWFYWNGSGSPLYNYTGCEPTRIDGCHGMREFFESRGYTVTENYTQLIYGYSGNTQGFTLADYHSEIDAGRPVLIQVSGHTMVGVGYEDGSSDVIYLHDTWDYSVHSMNWGGSYSGMQHYAMTAVELGAASGDYFTIQNLGTGDLSITSISDNASWLSTSGYPGTPFTITASNSQQIDVSVNWSLVGSNTQYGIITINSDDPDEPVVTVNVTAVPSATSTLSVSPSNRNVSSDAGTTTFSITSNTTWTVSDNAGWLSVSPTSGSNNGTITATYTENTGNTQRTGTITVSGSGVSDETVTVTQAAPSPTSYLTVTPANQNVTSPAGSTSFTVSSNTTWSVSDDAAWLTVSPTSGSNNATLTASYTENTNSNQRIGTITVSGSGVSNEIVTVTQAGYGGSSTTVFINPNAQTVNTSEVFTTTVEISQVPDLGAWEFEISFDPSLLQANSITLGSFVGSTGNTVIPIASNIDNVNGLIESAVSSFGSNLAASGSGVLITIEWISNSNVTSTSTSDLILQNEQFLTLLAAPVPVTLQNGAVTISPCRLTDVDCDCDVDIVDVQLVASHYGTAVGDPGYDSLYDLDSDGDIDIVDVQLVAADYGWTCSSSKSAAILNNVYNDNVLLGISNKNIISTSENYEINIFIEDVQQLGGFEFDISFNPENLRVLSIEQGDFLSSTNRTIFPIINTIDNEKGIINYSLASLGSDKNGASGKGSLITIICEPIKSGFSNFGIENAQIVRIDASIINYDLKESIATYTDTYIMTSYPNPFRNEMFIKYHVGYEGDIAFKIHDMYGNLILQTEKTFHLGGNYEKFFNRDGLKSGIYLFSLLQNDVLVSYKKIIVN